MGHWEEWSQREGEGQESRFPALGALKPYTLNANTILGPLLVLPLTRLGDSHFIMLCDIAGGNAK